jgi:dihydroxycyclohexadiene carboxylate dehydrogenase
MMSELDPRATGAKRLKDKVCVVTGAGQGIGRATARRLGEEGGKIVVAERIDESATRTTAALLSTALALQGLMQRCQEHRRAKRLLHESATR